jgi:radical SAM superfamily enzyme YgiQ (UPF0313 family)
MVGAAPPRVVLASTYELGRQPFGLASAAAWAREAGASVTCLDLAVEDLDENAVAEAQLIAFYIPMHTATRLAAAVAKRARALNSSAHLCFFGLYAPMNEDFLRSLGAGTILGGEYEEGLQGLIRRLAEPGGTSDQTEPVVSVARQRFLVPDRSGLPELSRYAHLTTPSGETRTVGYTEATRGCKHLCRHCPIVPVYQGRFRVVQREVVARDIANQVEAGARHITFGDPDFLNGPTHAIAVVDDLHRRFPGVSYDLTVKVEHLVKHAGLIPRLAGNGCVLITTAVESFDDEILRIFDKRHTREDVARVVELVQRAGIGFNPTFVAFTPWTTRSGYLDFLDTVAELDLIPNVAPVQYAIRLLVPRGSKLLELPDVSLLIGDEFDTERLSYHWRHPDHGMDHLFLEVDRAVRECLERGSSRTDIFATVRELARAKAPTGRPAAAGHAPVLVGGLQRPDRGPVPYLSEPWYC